MLDRVIDRDVHRTALSELVERCAWQVSAAAETYREQDSRKIEMVEAAKELIAAALERPAVLAAFADLFAHPDMVIGALDAPTHQRLDKASDELFRIVNALKDQRAAADMLNVLADLRPLQGPTPWDTFYESPGAPERALMPLFGSRSKDVLAVGPVEGGDVLRSEGEQGLFYPIGGYQRFAEATSLVVAQTLADGLAIDAVLDGDATCAVIVASAPDGVLDVCSDVRMARLDSAIVEAPGARGRLAMVAALAQADGPDSPLVRAVLHDGPGKGVSVVRPGGAPSVDRVTWSEMAVDVVLEAMRSAEASSRERLEEIVARRDERLDGFQERVRDLRAATQDTPRIPEIEIPARAATEVRSIGRRP